MRLKIIPKLLSKILFSENKKEPPQEVTSNSFEHGPLNEEWFRQLFTNCADVKIQSYQLGDPGYSQKVILVSCEGMADNKQINQFVLPRLEQMIKGTKFDPELSIELELVRLNQRDEIVNCIFSGHLFLYFSDMKAMYSLDISDPPDRTPEESNIEISIRGPKDSFIENIQTNVALVRKRLRTTSLRYEQFTIGKKTETVVALLYIDHIIRPEIINDVKERLNKIKGIDTLLGSIQLDKMLADSPYSLFPLFTSTGRPDFVVDCISKGRFALLVDGSPIAIIAPMNLALLIKSPEDLYTSFHIASFEQVIRITGLLIALFLPGFWVALASYNMEQLPFPLLATLVMARIGLPIPGPLEAFLMLGLFELFKEAGVRLPKGVGSTVAVVGGIIIGDAVIRAGFASTTMVIVSALTAVSTFTLVNQTLGGAVSIIRLLVLLCSSFLGMYGFILSTIAIVIHLSNLKSFGVPYLSPLSPIKPKDLLAAIFRKPFKNKDLPQFLREGDTNQGGSS